jgi:hypothetical protein
LPAWLKLQGAALSSVSDGRVSKENNLASLIYMTTVIHDRDWRRPDQCSVSAERCSYGAVSTV